MGEWAEPAAASQLGCLHTPAQRESTPPHSLFSRQPPSGHALQPHPAHDFGGGAAIGGGQAGGCGVGAAVVRDGSDAGLGFGGMLGCVDCATLPDRNDLRPPSLNTTQRISRSGLEELQWRSDAIDGFLRDALAAVRDLDGVLATLKDNVRRTQVRLWPAARFPSRQPGVWPPPQSGPETRSPEKQQGFPPPALTSLTKPPTPILPKRMSCACSPRTASCLSARRGASTPPRSWPRRRQRFCPRATARCATPARRSASSCRHPTAPSR